MPQFQFSSALLWSQVAWLAVFFVILYFGVVRLTLPKVGKVMQDREDQVSGDLDIAATAKAEADRMAIDYAAGIVAAQDAARARVTEARAASGREIEAKLKKSSEAVGKKAAKAQADLDAARTAALGEVEGVAASAAADIVERLTGTRPSDGIAAKATQAVLG